MARRRQTRRRAVIIHGFAHARAAAAAARSLGVPVVLRSAPGAGAYAGAPWFREIVKAVRAEFPDVEIAASLDCGDHPGWALAAIRARIEMVRFDGRKAAREKIAAIAARSGASLDADRAPALDLAGENDAEAACLDWLGAKGGGPSYSREGR